MSDLSCFERRFPALLAGFLLLVVLPGSAVGQSAQSGRSAPAPAASSALHDLRVDVGYLASDLLKGRETGTDGERLAARYIVHRFQSLGLSPGLDTSWVQRFDFTYSPNPHAAPGTGESRTGRNVVARLDRGAERTLIVGAHYDHLGRGGVGSRAPGDSSIHNGADDNASGVAALLEIARRLQATGLPRNHNVLFVAFSGEERGLVGSKHFVDRLPVARDRLNYMINLDMVGRLGDARRLAVNGTGTSPAWTPAARAAARPVELELASDPSGLGASDHTAFYLADVPAVHLFTGAHDDYHTPSDDSHRINYRGLLDVAVFAVRLIEELDDDGELAFTETDDGEERRSMRFEVSLGIMPDYVFEGQGLRIDAVLEDRPAARAGLQEGDVIVRVGEMDVDDIYAYMDALGQLSPGATATVVVQRGEERIEREVQF